MQTLMGTRKENAKLVERTGGREEWQESPIFSPTPSQADAEKINSDYVKAWLPETVLCGTFHGMTKAKYDDQGEQEKRGVAYFKTLDGIAFRAYTTGQLEFTLSETAQGSYVEITYNGKVSREIKGKTRNLHDFKISVEEVTH